MYSLYSLYVQFLHKFCEGMLNNFNFFHPCPFRHSVVFSRCLLFNLFFVCTFFSCFAHLLELLRAENSICSHPKHAILSFHTLVIELGLHRHDFQEDASCAVNYLRPINQQESRCWFLTRHQHPGQLNPSYPWAMLAQIMDQQGSQAVDAGTVWIQYQTVRPIHASYS